MPQVWRTQIEYRGLIRRSGRPRYSGDLEAIAKLPLPELEKIVAATLTGMTTEESQAEVKKWMASAKSKRTTEHQEETRFKVSNPLDF